jgi:hypothetical protein
MRHRASLLALTVLTLAGCGLVRHDPAADSERVGPEIQIGSGAAGSIRWTAWIFRSKTGLVCLEIREEDGSASGGCGTGLGPNISGGRTTTTVFGGTANPAAASARVVLEDRSHLDLELVLPEPGVTDGIRYYVGSLGDAAVVESVEILDAAGEVLESDPVLH